MAGISVVGFSIVKFFRLLWTSFVALWVTKEKAADHTQDIESGIPVSVSLTETQKDIGISRLVTQTVLLITPSPSDRY